MLRSIYLTCALIGAPLAMTAVTVQPAYAQKDEVYTSVRNNFGAGSFDVVSFHQGLPVKGDIKITADWNGAQWRFANEANRDLFLSDPEKYAPAYGGYCAFGTAMGFKFDGDPTYWKIVDNQLYLNLSQDIQARWEGDIPGFVQSADTNWEDIADVEPADLQQ